MSRPITHEMVCKVREFLGEDGIDFFRGCRENHGKVDAVYMEGRFPHPVHFREGMNVRNCLRSSGLCAGWSDDDYDDAWVGVVEKVLDECPPE